MDDFSTALEHCGARGAQYVVVANHQPETNAATQLILKNLESIKRNGFGHVVLEGPDNVGDSLRNGMAGFMGQGLAKDPFLKNYLARYGNKDSVEDYEAISQRGQGLGLDVQVMGSNIVFQRADPASLLTEAKLSIAAHKKLDDNTRTPLMQALNGIAKGLTGGGDTRDAQRLLERMADPNQPHLDYHAQRLMDANKRVLDEIPAIGSQIKALPGRALVLYSSDFLWRAKDLDEALGPSVCRIDFRNGQLQPAQKVSVSPLAENLGLVSSWKPDVTVDSSSPARATSSYAALGPVGLGEVRKVKWTPPSND